MALTLFRNSYLNNIITYLNEIFFIYVFVCIIGIRMILLLCLPLTSLYIYGIRLKIVLLVNYINDAKFHKSYEKYSFFLIYLTFT